MNGSNFEGCLIDFFWREEITSPEIIEGRSESDNQQKAMWLRSCVDIKHEDYGVRMQEFSRQSGDCRSVNVIIITREGSAMSTLCNVFLRVVSNMALMHSHQSQDQRYHN